MALECEYHWWMEREGDALHIDRSYEHEIQTAANDAVSARPADH